MQCDVTRYCTACSTIGTFIDVDARVHLGACTQVLRISHSHRISIRSSSHQCSEIRPGKSTRKLEHSDSATQRCASQAALLTIHSFNTDHLTCISFITYICDSAIRKKVTSGGALRAEQRGYAHRGPRLPSPQMPGPLTSRPFPSPLSACRSVLHPLPLPFSVVIGCKHHGCVVVHSYRSWSLATKCLSTPPHTERCQWQWASGRSGIPSPSSPLTPF